MAKSPVKSESELEWKVPQCPSLMWMKFMHCMFGIQVGYDSYRVAL